MDFSPSTETFYSLDTLKGGKLIEDGKGSGPGHRQAVDGHFVTPEGLSAFVDFSLLLSTLKATAKVSLKINPAWKGNVFSVIIHRNKKEDFLIMLYIVLCVDLFFHKCFSCAYKHICQKKIIHWYIDLLNSKAKLKPLWLLSFYSRSLLPIDLVCFVSSYKLFVSQPFTPRKETFYLHLNM